MYNNSVTKSKNLPDNIFFTVQSMTVRTHAEVAAILGINEKTVRRNEKSALEKLTRKLAARGYDKYY